MNPPQIIPPGRRPCDAPLRTLILGALAEAFITRRSAAAFCADCMTELCPDHRQDYDQAAAYEAAYARVAGIGSDGAMLALTGGLT